MRDTETPATEERASWTVRVLGAGLGTILTLGSLGWAADLYRADRGETQFISSSIACYTRLN